MTEFEVYEAAKILTDPVARAAYVEQACRENAELRASVMALLEASEHTCEFFNEPELAVTIVPPGGAPPVATATSPPPEEPGEPNSRVINGRYKLIEQIGEGGQGTVFKAEDLTLHRGDDERLRKYNRYVALKLVHSSMSGEKVLQRFLAERQALAMMDHPNIAKFLDAGHTRDDGVYFVMELVKGIPIAQYCDQHQLSLDDRLALMIQVSHAVQHAHHKGIIHRDLKPGNILVAEYDGKPTVKVIDFGLAKALGEPLTDDAVTTGFFGVVGTIQYMAPEQATFNQLDIDTRADVYAMTVILYELLTGSTPHSANDLKLAGVMEQLRMVREEEPPKASNRLSSSAELPSLAAYRQSEPRKLIGILRRELDAVLMKGLEKDRNRRYESPFEFAADLERFLNREPVMAVPPSFAYRASKFIRRRWKPLLVAVLVLTTITASTIGLAWQEKRRQEAVQSGEINILKRKAAEEREARTKLEADFKIREADGKGYLGTMGRLVQESHQRLPGWSERSWSLLQKVTKVQSSLRVDADIRSAAVAVLIADEYRGTPDWILKEKVRALAYSPSGKLLAIAPYADFLAPLPRVQILNAATKEVLETLSAADNLPHNLKKNADGLLRSRFDYLQFLDSDHSLISATRYGRLYKWDLSKSPPEKTEVIPTFPVDYFVVTSDFKWCIVLNRGSALSSVQCFDLATLRPVTEAIKLTEHIPAVGVLTAAGGDSVFVHTAKGLLALTVPDLKETQLITSACTPIHPSGRFFALRDRNSFRAMSWPDRRPLFAYRTDANPTWQPGEAAASEGSFRSDLYSDTGQVFATVSVNDLGYESLLWDGLGGDVRWRLRVPAGSQMKWEGHAMTGDAYRVAIRSGDAISQYSRLRENLAFHLAPGHSSGVRHVQTSPDGKEVAVLGERRKDGRDFVAVYRTAESPDDLHAIAPLPVASLPPMARNALSYSPDGKWLASFGAHDRKGAGIVIRDRTNVENQMTLLVDHQEKTIGRPFFDAATLAGFGWSARGELVAAIGFDLFAWDLNSTPPKLASRYSSSDLRFAPVPYQALSMYGSNMGYALTSASELHRIQASQRAIEIKERTAVPGSGNTRICRIDPTGRRLAIGKTDGTIVLYDTDQETFGNFLTETHSDSVEAMLWLNEHRLITGSRDGWLAIWDLNSAGQLTLWYRLLVKSAISDIAPTGDRQAIYVACTGDESLRVLELAVIDQELDALFNSTSTQPSLSPLAATGIIDVGPHPRVRPKRVVAKSTFTAPTEVAAVNYADERLAAEWVLSCDGTVGLKSRDGNDLPLQGKRLPDEEFTVVSIRLAGTAGFANAGMENLRRLSNLQSVALAGIPTLTTGGLSHLNGKGIRSLVIDDCRMLSDESLHMIATLDQLETLSLQRIPVTNVKLSALKPVRSLRNLNVASTRVTDEGLLELATHCPDITAIAIDSSPDGQQTVQGLTGFHRLTELTMTGSQLTDDAVAVLNRLSSLKVLNLRAPFDDAAVKRLGLLPVVRVIVVDSTGNEARCSLSPGTLGETAWCPNLRELYFNGTAASPSDEDLANIAAHSQLTLIGVSSVPEARHQQRYTYGGLVRLRELRPDLQIVIEHVLYDRKKPILPTAIR